MLIQNIDVQVWFLRVQLFIKVSVLALALHVIMVITRFHNQKTKFSIKDFFSKCDQIRSKLKTSFLCSESSVTREVVHSLCRNFPLFRNSVNILLIYSERLRAFLSNFETLLKFSNISIISAYAQIAFTCH